MFILLVLEDPLGSNDVMILSGRPLHKRPHPIPGETSELILHSNEPIRIFKGLFDPKWFNTRHKREVAQKFISWLRVTIPCPNPVRILSTSTRLATKGIVEDGVSRGSTHSDSSTTFGSSSRA